jgi:hypothetical protein
MRKMRTARRARPEVVTLEGRTLMSAAPLHHRVEAAHVSHVRVHKHPMVLNGNTLNVVIANKNGIAQVTGSGRMSGLGKVTITSAVNSHTERSLLVQPWLLYANAVISSRRGQVDVKVTPGTIGINPFAQPVHLQYAINGGTGEFKNATGKGLVDLSLFQAIPRTLDELKQMGNQLDTTGIRFKLKFHPGHLNQWGNFASVWYPIIQTVAKASAGVSSHPKHANTKK